jgi:hypothetical protein
MKPSADKESNMGGLPGGAAESEDFKKGAFGSAIGPMGVCMTNQVPSIDGYSHTPDVEAFSHANDLDSHGIGQGDGGPSDERAGDSGKGL